MAVKKFYVGCKGIVQDKDRGILLLHRGYRSGDTWDVPGGRIDGDEDIMTALTRELNEELPGIKNIKASDLVGAHRVHRDIEDDISLVLIYYLVKAELPEPVAISEEHQETLWVQAISDIPEGINSELKRILESLLN